MTEAGDVDGRPTSAPASSAEPETPRAESEPSSPGDATPGEEGGRDDAAEFEGLLQPGGRRSWVVGSVRAQASFVGTTHIGSVVIGDQRQHLPVPLTDLVALHAGAAFVPPPGYPELKRALLGNRVVVCHGPDGCGKELAVTRALLEGGDEVVRLLPVSLDISQTRQVVEVAAASGGAYVLPGLDDKMLRALAGIAGQSIRALASEGRVKVVVVTAVAPDALARRHFAVASVEYPDAALILDSYCAARGLALPVRQLAAAAIARLSPPLSPAVITAVLDQAAANSGQSPEELADSFSGALTANAVHTWVTTGRQPQEVAMLAAGASLPGASALVAQEQAVELCGLLTAGRPDQGAPPVQEQSAVWPAGLLLTRTQLQNTHFGRQPVEVVDIAEPHRSHEVIQAAWRALGSGFHSAYCDWLSALAGARQLRWRAAYTAGVLFAVDPAVIESRVLRTWLHSRDPAVQRCAGLALGSPVAIGADITGARMLAHAWATSDSRPLRRAAVAAYGGLLGAWDTASAAPLKLFLIGQLTPQLRGEADNAMARLVVSGADAVAARSTVISYLRLAAETPSSRNRAFGCLAPVVWSLNWPGSVCAESFAALREEKENWAGLIGLLGTALVSSAGAEAGQRSLEIFVRAAADGALDYEVIEDVIREMKAGQRRLGNAPRLGQAVRRVLILLSRSADAGVRDVAAGLLKKFFD